MGTRRVYEKYLDIHEVKDTAASPQLPRKLQVSKFIIPPLLISSTSTVTRDSALYVTVSMAFKKGFVDLGLERVASFPAWIEPSLLWRLHVVESEI